VDGGVSEKKNPSLPVWQEGLDERWVRRSSLSGPGRQVKKLLLGLENEDEHD